MNDSASVPPAFYARRGGVWADWWTLLHPPYTAWHLSYVVIGAGLATSIDWTALAATVLAFALAVGVAAHALDELHGRPLGTQIRASTLRTSAGISLSAAVAIGGVMTPRIGWRVIPLIVVGVALVLGYNLELFGGRLHTDIGFALCWGGFPTLVGWLAQRIPVTPASVAALAAVVTASTALSLGQRRLSTPARLLRRQAQTVSGTLVGVGGNTLQINRAMLLHPLEEVLRAFSWAVPLLAIALLLSRA